MMVPLHKHQHIFADDTNNCPTAGIEPAPFAFQQATHALRYGDCHTVRVTFESQNNIQYNLNLPFSK